MNTLNDFINDFVKDFVNHHEDIYLNDLKHNGVNFKEYMNQEYSFKDSLISTIEPDLSELVGLAGIEYNLGSRDLERKVFDKVKKPAYKAIKNAFLESVAEEIERIEYNLETYDYDTGYNKKDKGKFIKQLDILKKELIELQQ